MSKTKINRKMLITTLLFILFLAGLTTISAIYTMNSNHLSHTSSNQAIITLTQNATTSIAGVDTVRLTASEASLTGTTVNFYDGAILIGTSASSAGQAILDYPIVTAKVFDFHATASHP